jgi:hypothetical protein
VQLQLRHPLRLHLDCREARHEVVAVARHLAPPPARSRRCVGLEGAVVLHLHHLAQLQPHSEPITTWAGTLIRAVPIIWAIAILGAVAIIWAIANVCVIPIVWAVTIIRAVTIIWAAHPSWCLRCCAALIDPTHDHRGIKAL